VRERLGGQPFLLLNGDVFFGLDLRALAARHGSSGAVATLALRRLPEAAVYSTVVSDRRGRILAIAGRPRAASGVRSMFAGAHVLDPRLLDRLPEGASDSVRDLHVPLLAEGALLAGVRSSAAWYDFGRPALYRDAQLRMLRGRGRRETLVAADARVAASAELRRSVVGARARVAAGARVGRSVLWDGARVEVGARVERAIVTAGAVVRSGERAENVIVMPAAALGAEAAGYESRGEMAWVEIE
jgi:mannose-1-phosphate guanylyltransferase